MRSCGPGPVPPRGLWRLGSALPALSASRTAIHCDARPSLSTTLSAGAFLVRAARAQLIPFRGGTTRNAKPGREGRAPRDRFLWQSRQATKEKDTPKISAFFDTISRSLFLVYNFYENIVKTWPREILETAGVVGTAPLTCPLAPPWTALGPWGSPLHCGSSSPAAPIPTPPAPRDVSEVLARPAAPPGLDGSEGAGGAPASLSGPPGRAVALI